MLVQHVVAALDSVGGATHQQEVMMDGEEVMHFLNSMFDHASKDIPEEAPEEISCLMFRLFDRWVRGQNVHIYALRLFCMMVFVFQAWDGSSVCSFSTDRSSRSVC